MRGIKRGDQLLVREDVDAILGALLDIRREVTEIRRLLEDADGEEEEAEETDPAVHADLEARYRETTQQLEERIAFHRAKLVEERERAAKRAALPTWRRLVPFSADR